MPSLRRAGRTPQPLRILQGLRPDHGERVRRGIMRRFAVDPDYLDRVRERARVTGRLPQAVEARRAAAKHIRLDLIGKAAMTAESRAKAGRSISAQRLAWCPLELRDAYKALVRSKKIPAAEARAMIMEQHAADMAKFRAGLMAA